METSLARDVAELKEQIERRFYGKYRGFVVDNADPKSLGRLKVTVPGVLGDGVFGWALPCVPFGGAADQGFLFVPEIDATVWVEFEHGDPSAPIWVGTFWGEPGGESELPKPVGEGAVQSPPESKILKTRSGHTIELADREGEEKVVIRHKDDHTIVLSGEGVVVSTADGVALELKGSAAKVAAPSITLDSNSIALGSGAAEPVVLGNQLLALFNAHTHATAVGPSGPPVPLATAALLSPGAKAK